MDGLVPLFSSLIGLLVLSMAALGFGVDSRTYTLPTDTEVER